MKTILKAYEQSNSTRGDGSTITIMLVVNKPSPGIRIWWIGDSSCRVYENEIEIWRSVDHNSENYNERLMMRNKKFVEEGKNDESKDGDPFTISDVDTMLNYLKNN